MSGTSIRFGSIFAAVGGATLFAGGSSESSCRFEDPIEPMNNDNIRHGNFEDDPREPDEHMKKGWALVRCREASGYIWWGKKMEL